ncbi:MAG: MaoC family dehydratase [Ilumatobacteraceae bacterium]
MTIAFEDFEPGRVFDLGSVDVTEDAIIEFATQFDPQPFHIDPAAAADTVFGGLIASGWHTCSLYMRLYVDQLLADSTSQGSPGVDEVRWLAPVRPGDRLSATITVLETNRSATKPRRGTVKLQSEMTNQDGVVVMRMIAIGMYGTRS